MVAPKNPESPHQRRVARPHTKRSGEVRPIVQRVVMSSDLPATRKAWWARPSSILVGLASGLSLVLVLFGWLLVVPDMTGDARSDCAQTYLERFDDGEVLEAKRHWLPPHLECTVRYPPAGETYTAYRPHQPVADFFWLLGATVLTTGGFGFLVRRRHREHSTSRS